MAGKHVVCSHCKLAVTVRAAKPDLETATTDIPPPPHIPERPVGKESADDELPSIRKEAPRRLVPLAINFRPCRG
jgi:hypothetical protein